MRIENQEEMEALGKQLASQLAPKDVICLYGALGVGKSVLARAMIRHLLKDERAEIPSPSFTLIQQYDGDARILHIDLYRLGASDELIELGVPDLFSNSISIIEWPERLGELLPSRHVKLVISDKGGDMREINAEFHGEWNWREWNWNL